MAWGQIRLCLAYVTCVWNGWRSGPSFRAVSFSGLDRFSFFLLPFREPMLPRQHKTRPGQGDRTREFDFDFQGQPSLVTRTRKSRIREKQLTQQQQQRWWWWAQRLQPNERGVKTSWKILFLLAAELHLLLGRHGRFGIGWRILMGSLYGLIFLTIALLKPSLFSPRAKIYLSGTFCPQIFGTQLPRLHHFERKFNWTNIRDEQNAEGNF